MRSKSESLDLIARYLNEPTDPNLQSEIASFRAASAENEVYFLEIEQIWINSERAGSLVNADLELAAEKLKSNLPDVSTKSRKLKLTWPAGIAAAISLLAIGYLLYSPTRAPELITKATIANQIDSVKLADGSILILAANSEVRYPKDFAEEARETFLTKGQVFFKVSKDEKHPFKVVMNQSKVIVLGTSFNLSLTENTIELTVKTGRVQFSPSHNGATSILTAGQALSYDIKKQEIRAKNSQNSDAWFTKELVFVDTPLEEVCKQLSAYYGTEIILDNKKHEGKKLNAKFKDQPLSEVLLVLNETYGIKIKNEKNQIHLITP